MANDLTAILPVIYRAMDTVSRELTGLIPAVTMDASAERAALNQSIRHEVSPAGNVADITPANVPPAPTGQTSAAVNVIITKSRAANFGFTGDEQKELESGVGYSASRQGKIEQAIRSIVNEVETDLAALQSGFSRAFGTPGTAPFGTANDYTAASNALKILKDNGAPLSDNHLTIDTAAGVNLLGKQAAVNTAGTDTILRQGVLLDITGMAIRESAQIKTQTKGAMASATTNTAGYAIGATAITLATAGTGVVAAGDIITFAGDTNKYVINSVVFAGSNPAAGDVITLNANGLRVAIAASATAITVVATSARNMCFNRGAIVLAARAPAMPEEGDGASDTSLVTDPRSGLTMEVAVYKQYKQVRYEIGLAWGVKIVKPEHTALLLG